MSERFRFTQQAGPDERFAPGCMDARIGQTFPVKIGGRTVQGTLVSAKVSKDGSEIAITAEVPDGTLPAHTPPAFSIRRRP